MNRFEKIIKAQDDFAKIQDHFLDTNYVFYNEIIKKLKKEVKELKSDDSYLESLNSSFNNNNIIENVVFLDEDNQQEAYVNCKLVINQIAYPLKFRTKKLDSDHLELTVLVLSENGYSDNEFLYKEHFKFRVQDVEQIKLLNFEEVLNFISSSILNHYDGANKLLQLNTTLK